MLASGIKGIRVQLGIESDPSSTIFMRRRLGCPVCLQRGASPPFHSVFRKPPGLIIPLLTRYSEEPDFFYSAGAQG